MLVSRLTMETRINKYLAEQGYASRREADGLIAQGLVKLNGQIAKLGDKVKETDKVEVLATPKNYIYLAYHKPRGVATEDIPLTRLVGHSTTPIFPIGRLDKESEGLMILTNDGRLTTKLLGEKNKVEKEYVVEVDKKVDGLDLKRMASGMEIEGEQTRPAKTARLGERGFKIILTEGKKHQIRRMGAGLGYQVLSLKRVRLGDIHLGQLPAGATRVVKF